MSRVVHTSSLYLAARDTKRSWYWNSGVPDSIRLLAVRPSGQRVRGVHRIFHIFRIDHVLGFYRIYAFPWRPQRNEEFLPLSQEEMLSLTNGRAPHFAPRDDSSQENCEASRREGEEYLRVVLEEAECRDTSRVPVGCRLLAAGPEHG